MKKIVILSGLISLLFMSFPEDALAKKKYRYIKRQHGVILNLDSTPLLNFAGFSSGEASFHGAYTYNYKGRIEFGSYLKTRLNLPASIHTLRVGLLTEYNFIKNRGKRKMIPSAGLKLGFKREGLGPSLETGLYGSLKYFVAKRTSIIGSLEYMASVFPLPSLQTLEHGLNLNVGFAYYFDFY